MTELGSVDFLYSWCITQNTSFGDLHLMTSINWFECHKSMDRAWLQDKSSYHKRFIPCFWGANWIWMFVWISTDSNLSFYDIFGLHWYFGIKYPGIMFFGYFLLGVNFFKIWNISSSLKREDEVWSEIVIRPNFFCSAQIYDQFGPHKTLGALTLSGL